MRESENIVGKCFGRLIVVSWAGKDRGNNAWNCICDCGNSTVARSSPLGAGDVKSCGCLKNQPKDNANYKSYAYSSWSHMKNRCLNPNHERYKDWGGRGITVCERWMKFENF